MIKRTITKLLQEAIKHAPVTLLTGPRQIGKTTLLNELFNDKSFNYVSLDKNELLSLAKNSPEEFLSKYKYPLIIDEVQKAPELMSEINAIVNESKVKRGNLESNSMYVLSGSNRKNLMEKSSEALTGRMLLLDMWPLSLSEILNRESKPFCIDFKYASKRYEQCNMSELKLFEYILKGFMPSIYNDPTQSVQTYYSSYINIFLEKDFYPIMQVKDHIKFYNFLKILASNVGQELIYENYAKDLNVSAVTIKSWIDTLIKIKIIYLLHPYNETSFKKTITKRSKLYFFDTGVVCSLLQIEDVETLMNSYFKGRIYENFVVNEIIKSFQNNGKVTNFYYFRNNQQQEIDLVYIEKGKLNCVEIKCGSSFNSKDISSAEALKDSMYGLGKKVIIGSNAKPLILENNVIVMPASII